MAVEDIWYGKSFGARVGRVLLAPLGGLYWLVWESYLGIYRLGLKRAKEPHAPVICIGNLTVGGSGKTPATVHVAGLLRELGHEVVIGVSGYGSPRSEGASLAPCAAAGSSSLPAIHLSDGSLTASEWGDEPAMIRWMLPEVPLIVGRNRVRAAQLCHEHFPGSILLMDDGLQHLPVRKHLQICLDSQTPANRFVLPAGPYREPRSSQGRMDLVVESEAESVNRSAFRLVYDDLEFLQNGETMVDRPDRAVVLCAIARPQRFVEELTRQGVNVAVSRMLGDHDPLTAGNLLDGLPDLPIVVTAKDWVKLRERSDLVGREVLVAVRAGRIEPEDEFRTWLRSKLNEIAKA